MLSLLIIRSQVWLAELSSCLQSSSWLLSWPTQSQQAQTTPSVSLMYLPCLWFMGCMAHTHVSIFLFFCFLFPTCSPIKSLYTQSGPRERGNLWLYNTSDLWRGLQQCCSLHSLKSRNSADWNVLCEWRGFEWYQTSGLWGKKLSDSVPVCFVFWEVNTFLLIVCLWTG